MEIFDEIRWTTTWTCNAILIRMYSAETTGLIFTKILHSIVALVALFKRAYTWRYPIPFLNARAKNVPYAIFAQNSLSWQRPLRCWKKSLDRSLAHKVLLCGEKIVKIGPVHPEIFDEICQTMTWRPNITKILHDILVLVALFNHAYTQHYPIPFLNARATSEGGRFWRCQNARKLIGYHSNVPLATTKRMSFL